MTAIKSATLILVSLLTFHFSLITVFAGSGLVSQVGGATFTQGAKHFWVTSSTPSFQGVTTASAKVSGTVGSQSVSATADSSGNWSWTPASALSGDNQVTITSGSQTASFTLTIGALPANIASASAGSLAPAGTITPTFIILGLGLVLTGFGLWGFRKTCR